MTKPASFQGYRGWFNIYRSINLMQHISRLKYRNYVFSSIEAEKSFDEF